ncbi:MAG: PASTA domain-containing protein, partial [Acidimicrobiales bacterium]
QTSTSVAAGSVITTDPPPGAQAPQSSAVKLIVSSGQAQVTIPSVVGTNAASAGNKLGQLGLNVVTATEPSTTIRSGDVTRTNPPAGSSVAAGSDVTIYVSTGKPQASVPNVVGQSQASASAVLRGAGFNASFTTQAVSSPSQDGVVLSQNPAAGTSAGSGSTVVAVVGSYTAPTTSTTAPAPTTTTTSPLPG